MSFSDNFWELRKKKKKEEESAPKRDSLGNLSFNGAIAALDATQPEDIAPIVATHKNSDFFDVNKTTRTFKEVAELDKKYSQENPKPQDDAWYKGWFKGGAFRDGYQFGDVVKTILGTTNDITKNATSAAVDATENLIDTAAYGVGAVGGLFSKDFQDDVGEFIARDTLKYDKTGKAINEGLNWTVPHGMLTNLIVGDNTEEYSLLADKGDGLVQSGAHLAGSYLLSLVGVPAPLTMGVNAFGSEIETAYGEGATHLEAGVSGAVSAGAEILFEKLSGGIKILKGTTADDAAMKWLSTHISNEVVRTLTKFGIDMAGEGAEEVATEAVSALGRKLTYADEKEWKELFSKDDALEAFLGGAILSGAVGGGKIATSKIKGVDYTSGMTASEEKVFKSVYEDRIAQAEADGKKLTGKEKNKIYDEVFDELKKGYIDTDTIESVLGGDVYKMYKNSLDTDTKTKAELEQKIAELIKTPESQFTVEQREQLTELREKLETLNNDTTTQSWRDTLNSEISQKLQNSRLIESYNEQTRRGLAFKADISKYDTKQQAVIQKAIDSGILNNTNRTHEFVDMVAKISADKGVSFDFADNAKLKDTGFALDGKTVNGYVTKDGVTLNIDSHKSLNSVVGHEITHVLEGTEIYTELQNTLFEYAKTKGEYDGRLNKLTELYKGVKDADVNAELTADLVGDYLFSDGDFITHLSTTNRNVFQKIYDEIMYLYKVATAGSKEKRELEKVKKAFDKAYKASGKAASGTKYSVSDKNIKEVSTGYAYNETYFTMSYTQDGKVVGTLEYGEYDGAPNVKMVQVDPEYRRKGIATKLLQELQNKYPGTEIDFGMSTPDGTKLLDAITYDVTDEAVATDRQKLKDLQTELNDLQEKLDVLYDTDNLTEEQENELHSLGDRWQDVYETISKLEKELRGKRSTKTFVKTDTKYSVSDSDGKQLTAEQNEYFKNSKMRDDNGNLKVMYHGSQDAGFHVFDSKMSDDDTSFFFVDRNDVATTYSGTSETYAPKAFKTTEDANKFFAEIGQTEYEVVEGNGKYTLLDDGDEVATSDSLDEIFEEWRDWSGLGYGDANYKVYLNLENPLEIDAKGRPWNKIDAEFSQEIYDRYQSLTAEEKAALTDLTEWEDFSLFNREIQEAKDNELASAYEKLGGDDANIYDIFTIAADNFSEETLRENAVKYLKTRDFAQRAKEQGYDGVIFKNIVDNGGYSNGSEGASTVAIAFSSEQIKSVGNDKPTANKDIRYSLSEDSNGNKISPAVQKRFGNSKVVDENGALKVVYHGTATGEFSIFDKTKGSVEGDFGSGFYFTDNEADVSEHYEGGGPDFENKVGRRADEIYNDLYLNSEDTIDYDEAERRAREELFKGSHKFEVYLNIENPAIVGETTLLDPEKYYDEYDRDDYDSDEDYEGDVEQLIIDDVDGILWDIQQNLDVDNTDGIANVLFDAINDGGIDIESLKKNINELYLDNDRGELIGNEVTRQIIESLGYDGIVDPTVSGKWNMDIEDGTTHYIVFKPNQIKAITNQDPTDNPDIHRSLSAEGEAPKRYGNYNVYGKDIKLEKAHMTEDVAPISPTTTEETKHMENGATDTFDELAPITEEEANAMASESLDSLTDADAPPEIDAPYYGEDGEVTVDDPFENRDIKEVGNRKIKAYMYENPEVKPFFQAEANVMLGDLQRGIKGERYYVETPDGRAGVYGSDSYGYFDGTKRQVHPDIEYLLDECHYTYKQIEDGLNAIIEDHGAENNAVSKRIEFLLNDRLLNGTVDINSFGGAVDIPPNQDYINLLNEKQITEYNEETKRRFFETADDYAPIAETPVAETKVSEAPISEAYEAIRPPRGNTEPRMTEAEPRMKRADSTNKAPDGMEERSWIGTSTESEAVDGIITPDDIPDDVRYYQVKSNKKTLETANARLARDGYAKSREYFEGRMSERKLTVEDIALGERLIQEAAKAGDAQAVRDLIIDVSIIGTELGQRVQALSMIRRLTPEGQLKALIRTVERGKAKGDKAFDGVEVTEDMTKRITDTIKEDGTFDQAELDAAVEDVKQQIADKMSVGVMDYVNAWRYLSMLGNPKTHIRNIVSNVAMLGTRTVKNVVARTIEDIAPIKGRSKTWRTSTEAVKAFAKTTTAEMESVIKGDNKYSDEGSIKAKRKIFKTKVGNAVNNANTAAMEFEDAIFSKHAFRTTLQEYLTANGIKTAEDIKNNPKLVAKAKDYALEEARKATFRQDSYLANKISEIERKNPLYGVAVGSIMPFKKTPINIAKTGVAYSPLGFARNVYDAVQVGKGNMEASEAIDHLAQTLTGTSLTLIGFGLAAAGVLNGAGDDDKEGKYDYQLGKQSYSINLGGNTYSLSWLSPVAMPLFVGANAYEILVEKNEWNANVVIDTLGQTLDPMSEMSFISSLDDVLSSYDSGVAKIWGAGESMVQNYVTQFIPTALSQVASLTDDTKRSTKPSRDSGFTFGEETLNKIKYKIPGLRNTLEPTTDIWGNEMKQTENVLARGFESFFSPANKRAGIGTAVDDELKALYSEVGKAEILPAIPYNYIDYGGAKYDMSAKDYTEYKQTYGQTAYDLMESLFNTDTYKNATSEEKADMVADVYDYARDAAKKEYFTKYGVDFTNSTSEGKEVFKENPIKGAIAADLPVDEYVFKTENAKKYNFFKSNGISYDDYKNADEDGKRAYSWAYDNPEKYTVSKAVTSDLLTYRKLTGDLYDIKADKDANGKSISGSRKDKVADYINGLDLDYGKKLILFKSEYNADDTHNYEIVEYLNGRDDISYKDTVTILKELGFEVDSYGNVTWD